MPFCQAITQPDQRGCLAFVFYFFLFYILKKLLEKCNEQSKFHTPFTIHHTAASALPSPPLLLLISHPSNSTCRRLIHILLSPWICFPTHSCDAWHTAVYVRVRFIYLYIFFVFSPLGYFFSGYYSVRAYIGVQNAMLFGKDVRYIHKEYI